jgi:hypothetical protein
VRLIPQHSAPPDPLVWRAWCQRRALPVGAAPRCSTNSNIPEARLLTEATDVHITANTSARTAQTGILIRTGFYNDQSPNVVWTNSFREVTLQQSNQWVNFGSAMAIRLPAGNHTIY